MSEPLARLVDELPPEAATETVRVVRIERPGEGPEPRFSIYDREGLFLVYPFDSEIGKVLRELVGDSGVTYHRCHFGSEGCAIEAEELEKPW